MLSDFQLLKNKVQKVALQATRRKPVASTTEVMYNCAPKFHGSHYASEQHWSWNKTCQSGYLFYKCSCCHFFLFGCFFSYRMCMERKRLSFYKVRQPRVRRKMVLFQTKKYNYGRDAYGRWRKWLRPNNVLYRPCTYSNQPQLPGQSIEDIENQQFVPSTLRVNPDYVHVRMACSYTTFKSKDDVPIRRAPFAVGPPPLKDLNSIQILRTLIICQLMIAKVRVKSKL